MNASPTIETISLLAFVASLLIGALNSNPTYDTISALLFMGAIALFTYEIWWSPRYILRRKPSNSQLS